MSFDAVLKVGGSLSRGPGLRDVCAEIGRLAENRSILIVPGGGAFADEVRAAYGRYGLGETAAHRMALLAMDQYGYLLNELIPESRLVSDPAAAQRARSLSVLLPSAAVSAADPFPHSWQVTSDSISAWIAQSAGCRLLVLVKDVDGLLGPGGELIPEIGVGQLPGFDGGVDPYLARQLAAAPLEAWVVNGLRRGRITDLVSGARPTGTRIAPFGAEPAL